MAVATIAERIEAPAQYVWDYISWHGVARLNGGLFKRIDFFGDTLAVGITKQVHLAEGLPITERLEAFDEQDYSYRYRVTDGGPLPVTDYSGYVRVTPCGPDACYLKIECDYTPVTVTAEEWANTWRAMEHGIMEQIRATLST